MLLTNPARKLQSWESLCHRFHRDKAVRLEERGSDWYGEHAASHAVTCVGAEMVLHCTSIRQGLLTYITDGHFVRYGRGTRNESINESGGREGAEPRLWDTGLPECVCK